MPVTIREASSTSFTSLVSASPLRLIASSAFVQARRLKCAALQHLGVAEDGVERRPELVREGGQEFVLGPAGFGRRLLQALLFA